MPAAEQYQASDLPCYHFQRVYKQACTSFTLTSSTHFDSSFLQKMEMIICNPTDNVNIECHMNLIPAFVSVSCE